MFDYHKEKSPPSVCLHCVYGGRPYGSFIFQKALWISFKNFSFTFDKDKLFLFTHTSPMTDPEFILFVFSLNSWMPNFVRAVKCFRILQIHLEELEVGSFTASYLEIISAVMYMSYTLI